MSQLRRLKPVQAWQGDSDDERANSTVSDAPVPMELLAVPEGDDWNPPAASETIKAVPQIPLDSDSESINSPSAAVDRPPGRKQRKAKAPMSESDRDLRSQIGAPVSANAVSVVGRKGGVGKTTISAYLGLTMAQNRRGPILTLDGDPEAGPLGWLLSGEVAPTLDSLSSLNSLPTSHEGMRSFTARAAGGVEVIGSESGEFETADPTNVTAVARSIRRHYDIAVFDVGTALTRPMGRALLAASHVPIVVTGPNRDGARAAELTLDWLDQNGLAASNSIVVINGVPRKGGSKFIDHMESHFSQRVGAVVRIPWDENIGTRAGRGATLEDLSGSTRTAFMELAAVVIEALRVQPVNHAETAMSSGQGNVLPGTGDGIAPGSVQNYGPEQQSRIPTQSALGRFNKGEK